MAHVDNELYDLQLELESDFAQKGAERMMQKIENYVDNNKDLSLLPAPFQVMRYSLMPMLQITVDQLNQDGRSSVMDKLLSSIVDVYTNPVTKNPAKAILEIAKMMISIGLRLTLVSAMMAYKNQKPIQNLQVKIAKHMYIAARDAQAKHQMPNEYAAIMNSDKSQWQKSRELNKLHEQLEPLWWEPNGENDAEISRIGEFVLNILLSTEVLIKQRSIKLFEISDMDKTNKNKKPMKTVVFSEDGKDIVDELFEEYEWSKPLVRPMIVSPVEYKSVSDSAYLTLDRPMVKRKSHPVITRKIQRVWDDNPNIGFLLDSVNHIGSIEWRICRPMISLCDSLVGSGLCGYPQDDMRFILPEAPDDDDDPEKMKAYKVKCAKAHKKYQDTGEKSLTMRMRLKEATEWSTHERFYFPHFVDFRMRTYPMPHLLHPQISDDGRGVLEFAGAKPITRAGIKYIMRGLASTFGEDKCTYEEQEQWVNDNMENILACADNPYDNIWWHQADKPFMFIRHAIELEKYMTEGPDYESRLPVHIDATCSALQHFAALTKDLNTAWYVNLTEDQEDYHDAYQYVAAKVQTRVNENAESGDQTAKHLVDKVTRKMVKHNVMTSVYRSTPIGRTKQIIKALEKMDDDLPLGENHLDIDNYEAAKYLMPIVTEVVRDTFPIPFKFMRWLAHVIDVFTDANTECWMQTPMGIPVPLFSHEKKKERIMNRFLDIKLSFDNETDKLDRGKTKSGSAANPVHALDATHCHKIVNRCKEEGITISVIHDSFATHACDVGRLREIIWETFVEMYEGYSMTTIYEYFRDQLPDKFKNRLAKPPTEGDFKMSADKIARYSFR